MVIKKNNFGDKPNSFVSESGSAFERQFRGKLNKETGEVELQEIEPKDMYSYIQSFKDTVDINKIVERFKNGEVDIFDKVQGIFTDVSKAPKNLADAYQMINNANYDFDRLPIEIKQKFGNSFDKFVLESGTDEWFKKLGYVFEEKKEEGTESES